MKMFLVTALTMLSASAFAANCKEGNVQHWPSQSPYASSNGESGPVDVPWICHNGQYREQYPSPFNVPAPKHYTCRDGETYYWPSQSPYASSNGEGGPIDVPWVCRNGKFHEKYPSPFKTPAPVRGCKEGRIETFTTPSPDETNYVTEVYVCRNGSMKRIR